MKFETLFIYVFLLRELIVSHHWLYGAFMHAFHNAILKNNNATKIDKIISSLIIYLKLLQNVHYKIKKKYVTYNIRMVDECLQILTHFYET